MKKLLVSVLAIAGLVACTQETTLVQKGNAPMEFGGAFVENATRANAAVDPSTTTESITGFDVWGFMDQPSGKVFEGEDVTGETGNFTYVNTQYWLPGHDYYFAALAPMNSANWRLNTEAANTYGAGIVDFHNVDGTEDLLYAAKMVSTKGLEVGETPGVVKLQFNHLLSKVKFSFTNGFDNANAYIDVKEVTMEVPAFASINLAQQDWWSTNQWALVKDQFTTLQFGDACAKTAIGVKQETANERLTIPAGADQEYKVTFKVQLYFGDVAAFEEVQTLESVVKGVALEMGKAYNFTAEINASNISEDGKELLPIVFDVQEVKDWVDAGEQAGVIAGAVEKMTLFTDVQATERVVVSELLDGAGHTLSAVEGVNYVINNTARLIEAKAGSTIQNIKIDGKGNYTGEYGIRGIYTTGDGDVVVKNAEILDCTYAINANNAGKLTVINSTLQGWNSYGKTTTNHFENVKFIDGEFHNFRPYNNTVCKNCDFGAGVVIDLSQMVAGATIKFEGCTYNGQPLSPANLTDAAGKNVVIDMVVTEAPVSNGLVQNVNNVENMTIDGGNLKTTDGKGLRGIYITKGGEYNVNNVVVKNVTYAINVNTTETVKLNVVDSTLEGWTSFGGSTTATFTNVKFECGAYANFKPYASTTLTNCSFEAGFMIDFTSLNGVITFDNCTYNGTVLTADNFASLVNIDGDCTGKIAF
ncbi:MAG: fimbrillin family protein [Alistipes sp.]|nr:fimbrillin family protein [Alistipes sp.]MBR5771202.1 fimbrillin family protein [Alistipes sp.]